MNSGTRSGARVTAAALAAGVTALMLLTSGCALVPMTGRQQLSLVSQPELASLAADDYATFLKDADVVTTGDAATSLQRVGKRVADAAEAFLRSEGLASELQYYNWEFALVRDDETVNAFCMPGGRVVVYTGLLPVTRDDTGLAVVLSHEVAHAVANHSGERMSQLLVANLGGMALSQAIEQKPTETQDLLMAAYGLGANVGYLLPYSRQQESEADRIGLTIMAMAGYDPREAIPLWERMEEVSASRPIEFLSTHPNPSSRIAGIRKYLPEALKRYEAK